MAEINMFDSTPAVRNLNFEDPWAKKSSVALTLGVGTYLSNAHYEHPVYGNHIMIGNYCSCAHDITFVLGAHDYKNVSTFPFNNEGIFKQIYRGGVSFPKSGIKIMMFIIKF